MAGLSRLAVAGLAAAVIVGSARRARRGRVGPVEERVFRVLNEGPDTVQVPVWVVMQAGSLTAVFVVSGEFLRRGRTREAGAVLIAGTAVWAGVKAVKPLIGRGRPEHHLGGVARRGRAQTGLGYPSGHAAVSMTLAIVATHGLGPAARAGALGVALLTGGARVYTGAHLPLDVAAGLAAGVLCGGGANLIVHGC